MSEPMRFRIESKDGMTSLVDADTGRSFPCVSLKFEHRSIEDLPELTIVLNNFELVAGLQDVKAEFKPAYPEADDSAVEDITTLSDTVHRFKLKD